LWHQAILQHDLLQCSFSDGDEDHLLRVGLSYKITIDTYIHGHCILRCLSLLYVCSVTPSASVMMMRMMGPALGTSSEYTSRHER
jgi:hypothetical protein